MCTSYAPFVETLVTYPWQAKLLQGSYDRHIQYDNKGNMLPIKQNKLGILKQSREKERYKRHVISEITKARKEIILINGKIKRKRLVYHVQLCYRTKAKEGTTPSMWITSSAAEIIHFARMGLNGLCPNKSFILDKG